MSLIRSLLGGLMCLFCSVGMAQGSFPEKPIRIMVVYPPGGGGDILARTLTKSLAQHSGQNIIVENRPGAGGMIGTTACKNAAPDGYTYCMVLSDVVSINPHIFKNMTYDAVNDLVPVASVADVPVVFVTHKGIPSTNLKEFAQYTVEKKGEINWASWGIGTSAHLVMAHINNELNADLVHIPYQGVPQITTAMLNQEVAASMILYGPLAQHLENGSLKPLAVLSSKRHPRLPDVPTANEQGLNFAPTVWYGLFAPIQTPMPIVERMNEIVNQAMAEPEVTQAFASQGLVPLPLSQKEFASLVENDRNGWAPVAKSLNLALD